MKIGITCYPTYGGSGVIASELGIALAQKGHEIHFISYALPFRLQRFQSGVYFHEVQVTNYPLFRYPSYDLALVSKMVEVTQLFQLDLLHVHYAIPHAACAYLAKQLLNRNSPKIITTLHGTDITLVGNDKSFYPITRFSIEQSDGITAVSEFLKNETSRIFAIKNNIQVIHNFVNVDVFQGNSDICNRKHFAPNNEKILMHVSNFRPVKRVNDIVEIFARVRNKISAKLVLIGEGPDKNPAIELGNKLGVGRDIICLGMQDSLPDILPCADIYLLPSDSESFGLSALEAMASGVPVIGTKVGGLPEVITHNDTGFLYPVGDIEGMTNGVLQLLSDKKLMLRIKNSARECTLLKFNIRDKVIEYESYYNKILGMTG